MVLGVRGRAGKEQDDDAGHGACGGGDDGGDCGGCLAQMMSPIRPGRSLDVARTYGAAETRASAPTCPRPPNSNCWLERLRALRQRHER